MISLFLLLLVTSHFPPPSKKSSYFRQRERFLSSYNMHIVHARLPRPVQVTPHIRFCGRSRAFFSLTCCHHSLFTMARWWRFCRVAIGILEIRHWVASTFLFLVLFPPFLSVGAGGFARTELPSALLRFPMLKACFFFLLPWLAGVI